MQAFVPQPTSAARYACITKRCGRILQRSLPNTKSHFLQAAAAAAWHQMMPQPPTALPALQDPPSELVEALEEHQKLGRAWEVIGCTNTSADDVCCPATAAGLRAGVWDTDQARGWLCTVWMHDAHARGSADCRLVSAVREVLHTSLSHDTRCRAAATLSVMLKVPPRECCQTAAPSGTTVPVRADVGAATSVPAEGGGSASGQCGAERANISMSPVRPASQRACLPMTELASCELAHMLAGSHSLASSPCVSELIVLTFATVTVRVPSAAKCGVAANACEAAAASAEPRLVVPWVRLYLLVDERSESCDALLVAALAHTRVTAAEQHENFARDCLHNMLTVRPGSVPLEWSCAMHALSLHVSRVVYAHGTQPHLTAAHSKYLRQLACAASADCADQCGAVAASAGREAPQLRHLRVRMHPPAAPHWQSEAHTAPNSLTATANAAGSFGPAVGDGDAQSALSAQAAQRLSLWALFERVSELDSGLAARALAVLRKLPMRAPERAPHAALASRDIAEIVETSIGAALLSQRLMLEASLPSGEVRDP